METITEVRHQVVRVKLPFDQFTHNIEAALPPLDRVLMDKVGTEPAMVEEQLAKRHGHGFLFMQVDHGLLLTMVGAPRKAKLYALGNPLTLSKMTRLDMRAGLYGPLHLLVYEDDNQQVVVEYDLPSSVFGQFGNPEVKKVAEFIDERVAELIAESDQAAH
jgi:uncharacterized protein (DUF302 family)